MNRFFELTELPGGPANTIVDTVLQTLAKKKLSTDKMFEMATDEASVMVGVTHPSFLLPILFTYRKQWQQ